MDLRLALLYSHSRNRLLVKSIFVVFCAFVAYQCSIAVITNDFTNITILGLAAFVIASAIAILNDWRRGSIVFLVCLLFEDIVRKYAGNNMVIAFGKDAVLLVVYLAFFVDQRRLRTRTFRPPFAIPLLLFIWFGVMQMFNPASPSIWYGLLGLKLDFYYIPLLLVGYAYIDSEQRLRRFVLINVLLIVIIGSLGIAQAILGHTFLNPQNLAEDIRDLGALYRASPITGAISYRPTSVFVSAGRFADFLALAWLFTLGYTGYSLLRLKQGRVFVLLAVAVTAAAAVLSASRGVFMWSLINGTTTAAAFFWGAPWRQRETARMLRAVFRAILATAAAMSLLFFFFPDALASRLSLYSETLSPGSSASELGHRSWDYPVENFMGAFSYERWPYGYGIGTSSLGVQYVVRLFHIRPLGKGVESGYGTLVIELGVVGLCLWLIMTASIIISAWRVVVKLRGSPLFPLGFVIFWYAFILFFPATFAGIQPYQDFVLNAFVWLLLGILFRLPTLSLSKTADSLLPPNVQVQRSVAGE